jgi:hypothetical protein
MSNGMALDTMWVQNHDGTPFDRPDKLARVAIVFENVLTGKLKPHIALERILSTRRTSVFTVPPRVLIDNQASASHTVIEANGRDRLDLLWELTRELTPLSVQVSSVNASTDGEKVVHVLYVKNLFGHKVEHPLKLAEICTTLETVSLDQSSRCPYQYPADDRSAAPVGFALRQAGGPAHVRGKRLPTAADSRCQRVERGNRPQAVVADNRVARVAPHNKGLHSSIGHTLSRQE